MLRGVLGAAMLLAAGPATSAWAAGGGGNGGLRYGTPVRGYDAAAVGAASGAPVAAHFRVSPDRIVSGRGGTRFGIRIEGFSRRVRVRIDLTRRGRAKRAVRVDIPIGRVRVGRHVVYRWKPPAGKPLRPGRYRVVLHAVDRRGRVLARATRRTSGRDRLRVLHAPPAPPPPPPAAPVGPVSPVSPVGGGSLKLLPGVFPVSGTHDYGGSGSRFGVGRPGHVHEGQDVAAAEGTPLVAPRPGTIEYVAHQAHGAGYYVVMRDDTGDRDYVFMHMEKGSTVVHVGEHVTAGAPLGRVGSTGDATGPHLHFELWAGGWRPYGGKPVDPLPQLQRWDS